MSANITSVDPTSNATNTTPITPSTGSFLEGGSWNNNLSLDTSITGPVATSNAWACILFRGLFKIELSPEFCTDDHPSGSSLYITIAYFPGTKMRWWLDGRRVSDITLTNSNNSVLTSGGALRSRFLLDTSPLPKADHQFTFRAEASPGRPMQIEIAYVRCDQHFSLAYHIHSQEQLFRLACRVVRYERSRLGRCNPLRRRFFRLFVLLFRLASCDRC